MNAEEERLYRELSEEHKKLGELSRFKSELLSLASHQIRSPLAAMKGLLSLVLDGTYGVVDPRAKEALLKARHSADELIELTDLLLDLRQAEAGKMEYRFAKTDLGELARGVVNLMKPIAERHGLELSFAAPVSAIWVNADAHRLKQVIQNLVDNAVKYTLSGFVRVAVAEEPSSGRAAGAATVSVADSGIGISAAALPYIFDEFIRDERSKKEIRETGLGLYIAKKIVEAHGGKIRAESAGEGKGSVFHVSVPAQS